MLLRAESYYWSTNCYVNSLHLMEKLQAFDTKPYFRLTLKLEFVCIEIVKTLLAPKLNRSDV